MSASSEQRVAEAISARHGLSGTGDWGTAVRRALRDLAQPEAVVAADGTVDAALLDRVAGALTVPETYFMRHHAQLAHVCEHLVARLGTGPGMLRVLSAGCSNGAEPYSLVLCLMRALGTYPSERVDIHACDLSADAIEKALAGEYGSWSFRGVPAWLLERYFHHTPTGAYRLDDEIRSRVRFQRISIRDAIVGYPSASLDVVLFRNVGIYLSAEHLNALFREFHRALKPEGMLVVAPSDPRPLRVLFERTEHESTGVYVARRGPLDTADTPPPRPERRKPRPAVVDGVHPGRSAPPELTLPSRELIRAMADRGDVAGAIELSRKRTEANPSDADEHLLYGQMQLAGSRAEDRESGVESLRRAVFLAPEHPMARFWYVHALLAAGRAKKALGQLEALGEILDMLPDDSRFHEGEVAVAELREARAFLLESMR